MPFPLLGLALGAGSGALLGGQAVRWLHNERHVPDPVDCTVSGSWSAWSPCEGSCGQGKQYRTQSIVQQAKYGGKPCGPDTLLQVQDCSLSTPCGQDCVPGQPREDAWSGCPPCLPAGATETPQEWQYVEPRVQNTLDGRPCALSEVFLTRPCSISVTCPVDQDCAMEAYYTSPCNVSCGSGTQITFHTVTQTQSGAGLPCVWRDLVTQQACYAGECPPKVDCSTVSFTGSWTDCDRTCGSDGLQYRARAPESPQDHCPLLESRSCMVEPACIGPSGCAEPTPTDVLEYCLASCLSSETGAALAKERGLCSITNKMMTLYCGDLPAAACPNPQPCSLSDWGSWSDCSVPVCDHNFPQGGTQTRVRTIIRQETPGGTPCTDFSLQETRPCNNALPVGSYSATCKPVDCTLSDWEAVGGCSAVCGGGFAYEIRHIVQEASGGGQPCPANPADYVRSTTCNTDSCQNCSFVSWEEHFSSCTDSASCWSACDALCDGWQVTCRAIANPQQPGGAPCDPSKICEAGDTSSDCACWKRPCCVGCSCGLCPVGCNGEVCSGHGTCTGGSDVDGTLTMGSCTCDANWFGENCGVRCPVGPNGKACSGNGECGADGKCTCKAGITGDACQVGGSCILQVPASRNFGNFKTWKGSQIPPGNPVRKWYNTPNNDQPGVQLPAYLDGTKLSAEDQQKLTGYGASHCVPITENFTMDHCMNTWALGDGDSGSAFGTATSLSCAELGFAPCGTGATQALNVILENGLASQAVDGNFRGFTRTEYFAPKPRVEALYEAPGNAAIMKEHLKTWGLKVSNKPADIWRNRLGYTQMGAPLAFCAAFESSAAPASLPANGFGTMESAKAWYSTYDPGYNKRISSIIGNWLKFQGITREKLHASID